jgi:hypothetical protein
MPVWEILTWFDNIGSAMAFQVNSYRKSEEPEYIQEIQDALYQLLALSEELIERESVVSFQL